MTTRPLESLPHEIEHTENVFIPLADGTRLAARIWKPVDAATEPVPAVLEYIPYRKRDVKRPRDQLMHPYVAAHGYACVRVDLRGSGDSDGVLTDEYLEQELLDGEEVITWLADQAWCDGNVGMIGISWGGFNGLQLAARRPPALGAVVSVCSTDDRYADDVHYMGGCLLGDNLSWSAVMHAFNSMPPDPELVGESWRKRWFERLEGSGLWLDTWLRHPHRDAYWEHGSVCEDHSAIETPVLAVSGWADGYSNAVFRLLEHLSCPRLGLVGPWSHKYPNLGVPGPAIGFLQETVRWWDHWLKGRDTGIMDEPMLRAYVLDNVAPQASYEQRPGRWVTEPSWPSPTVTSDDWVLGGRWRLEREEVEVADRDLTVQSPLSLGLFAGKWCSYSATPDMPHDQREEDGGALVFESPPLPEPLEVLGAPELELTVAADQPVAMIAVRLSDTAPDDQATRVTYGILNLCHHRSHAEPEPLVPGEPVRIQLKLNDIGYRFPAGHRLRLAVSSSYWPLAWLAPKKTRLTITTEDSHLRLPVRQHRPEDDAIRFEPVEHAPALARTTVEAGEHTWLVQRDLATDTATLAVVDDNGISRIDDLDLEVESRVREWYSTRADQPTSARGHVESVRGLRRGDWHVRTITTTTLTCDETTFFLRASLDAYEGGERVLSRDWSEDIPRNLL
ncbi:MAG: CocE/NonD family hydrolase [Acidimicrobiales bacterium]|nr:CocE/NonD family hydrolase [Acidimicrobiales bacterium]